MDELDKIRHKLFIEKIYNNCNLICRLNPNRVICEYYTNKWVNCDIKVCPKIKMKFNDNPKFTNEKDIKPEEINSPTGHGTSRTSKIVNWKKIEIKDTDIILYYDPIDEEEKHGFNFYCITAHTWDADEKTILGCDCLFHGIAYWEEIRHLYFGDNQTNNYGYLYYPDVDHLVLALKELSKLEEKYCRLD